MKDKVVLAYSGGLDTSVCIKWLEDRYQAQVIALTADVGQGRDMDAIRDKALKAGAVAAHVADVRDEFITEYCWPALKANAMYEGKYPLSASLSRPLIAKLLVDVARAEGAKAVAHGCTGKGNDQVRFDVSVAALAPDLKVIAPVREWPMSREEEIEYALTHNIPVPVTRGSPYSIDQNLWGRSIECGPLEDPWVEPPADAFEWTAAPEQAPTAPEYLTISFDRGVPTGINGRAMKGTEIVAELNATGGRHGVGRIDHVENRLVGIKSREIYECPAAIILLAAHQDLESLNLTRETAQFKPLLEQKYAELAYEGLWYSPLRNALQAFIDTTQENIVGEVRVKLYRGTCQVVGRRSPYALYDYHLATYDASDTFRHDSAAGFIDIWGLPTRVHAAVNTAQAKRRLPLAGDGS
ncbi:MAG: argininosuccinate synthase [Bacillota bacterium]